MPKILCKIATDLAHTNCQSERIQSYRVHFLTSLQPSHTKQLARSSNKIWTHYTVREKRLFVLRTRSESVEQREATSVLLTATPTPPVTQFITKGITTENGMGQEQ